MDVLRLCNAFAGRDDIRRDAAVILALAALVLLPSLSQRDLWTPDEPRYMEVAREMAVTGDYLVPHLNGEAYPDKPPLFFWLAAGLFRLGAGYNAGRLVAALAGVGTLLMTYAFARAWMRRPGPLLAALCTLTTLLFFRCKAGLLDPLLMLFVTGALLCGYRALQPETRRRTAAWLGFYALVALAVLTKGPVGLLLPGLALLTYGIIDRKRVRGGGWTHLAGAALLAAIVAAWLVPAVIVGGEEYRNNIMFQQTLKRVVSSYSHRRPFYYFLVSFPVEFSPWALLAPLAIIGAATAWRHGRDGKALFVLSWFGTIFVFHSLVSGKRHGYLMPLIPALALMLGHYLSRAVRDGPERPRWHRGLFRATLGACGLAGVAVGSVPFLLPLLLRRSDYLLRAEVDVAAMLTPGVLATTLGGGAAILAISLWGYRAVGRRDGRAAGAVIAVVVLASLVTDLTVTPRMNPLRSARAFCEASKPILQRADTVHLLGGKMAGLYNLHMARVSMPVLASSGQLRAALSSGRRVAIIAERKRWRRMIGKSPPPYRFVVEKSVGKRRMVLAVNWPAEAD